MSWTSRIRHWRSGACLLTPGSQPVSLQAWPAKHRRRASHCRQQLWCHSSGESRQTPPGAKSAMRQSRKYGEAWWGSCSSVERSRAWVHEGVARSAFDSLRSPNKVRFLRINRSWVVAIASDEDECDKVKKTMLFTLSFPIPSSPRTGYSAFTDSSRMV